METPSRPNIHHHGHPYYPPAVPITNYVPNDTHLFRLLPFFGGVVGAFVALAYRQAARSRLPLRSIDRFAVAWYALCRWTSELSGTLVQSRVLPSQLTHLLLSLVQVAFCT